MSREIARRIEKLSELAATITKRQVLIIILERDPAPPWAKALPRGRCAYLMGGDDALRAEALEALCTEATLPDGVIFHDYTGKPGASRGIVEVVGGDGMANAAEVALWGARGDRKTSAALDALCILADRHRLVGEALPFRVMVPTGTHVEHKLKLCRTLMEPHWHGIWALTDDDHLATATVDGVALLVLDLFGVNDVGTYDRLRMRAHALWAEEVAPVALEGGGGVPADAWAVGGTSVVLPTPRKVMLLTSNLPDEDDWCWRRFEGMPPHPGTVSVRIPAGESASAEDRARWAVALQGRPDLYARLVAGEPGSISRGPQVAVGYTPTAHVAAYPLVVGGGELWLGWDSAPNAHTHAVTIGQRLGPRRVQIYACLIGEDTGFQQFLEGIVLPWFGRRAPNHLKRGEWLLHRVDPAMIPEEGGDYEQSPVRRLRRALGGSVREGPTRVPDRLASLLGLLALSDGTGGMAVQIDPGPDAKVLREAFASRWHYQVTRGGTVIRDAPYKPNHPWEDAGDSACYFASGIAPRMERDRDDDRARPQQYARTAFDKFGGGRVTTNRATGSLS